MTEEQALLDQIETPHEIKQKNAVELLQARGKDYRMKAPIEELGHRPVLTRDPVKIIAKTESNLIQELLPLRHEKMLASPAAFFRGTAELMDYDLNHEPKSGIRVLADGDAHLQNFGFYASPERNLLFDLNDFDEAAGNSFEFDLKRLVTSTYLLGSQSHFDENDMDDLARNMVKIYRKTTKNAFKRGALDRFFFSTKVSELVDKLPVEDHADLLNKIVTKASKRDNESVVRKFTEMTGTGELRFKENAPSSVHQNVDVETKLLQGMRAYMRTTRSDTALLLSQYHVTDIIRHSVGIGSFGTACYLVLMTGMDDTHLVLQVKEALPRRRELGPNALNVTLDTEKTAGRRIISAQQILQKASDPFLGWFSVGKKSFYVRQFRDMKESVKVDQLDWEQFQVYTGVCSFLLALAHAQTPIDAMACGYMNKSFDSVIQSWSKSYLHQVEDDYAAFVNQYGR